MYRMRLIMRKHLRMLKMEQLNSNGHVAFLFSSYVMEFLLVSYLELLTSAMVATTSDLGLTNRAASLVDLRGKSLT
jgi:hypothetical protein